MIKILFNLNWQLIIYLNKKLNASLRHIDLVKIRN